MRTLKIRIKANAVYSVIICKLR